MNIFKAAIATAAVTTCCMGNAIPAHAFWGMGELAKKDKVASMMANLACDVRAGTITAAEARIAGTTALNYKGWDTNLQTDPDVLRWAAKYTEERC
tara:strand:- start:761 stop:1048 length:288 start_codon:yes stop_codon:yes gene_type:complete